MVSIKIKWNKTSYDNVVIDVNKGVSDFKSVVHGLTGVPPDRQKLMAKGAWIGTLKDDADLSKTQLTEGHQVMLMGTADVVAAPTQSIVFLEDMTDTQKAEKGAAISAGLKNMGNTCYMNATVQCFRHMPELRGALTPVRSSSVGTAFTGVLRDTFKTLDSAGASIFPVQLVGNLRTNFPQFAQTAQNGAFMQQDAEEFFNVLQQSVVEGLASLTSGVNPEYNQLLGINMEEQQTCQETDLEAVVNKTERANRVVCNIQKAQAAGSDLNTSLSAVDHLHDGVKLGMEGTFIKHSSVLGRDAVWHKQQRIASLPKYLCFQFMRFFWKATPDNRDHVGVKCKIMRAVTYPETIDVYEMCSDTLKAALRVNREIADKKNELIFAAKRAKMGDMEPSASSSATATATAAASTTATSTATSATTASGVVTSMEVVPELDDDATEAAALEAAMAMSMGGEALTSPPAAAPVTAASATASLPAAEKYSEMPGSGVPSGFTGQYELHSIVTHKGRSADSGHYIGWARQEPGSDYWWKYDDEVVTETTTEEVMKLKGGGDRDIAYLMFYRFKDFKSL